MSDETPLSEAIQGFADLHEWVPIEAEILQCWADRAADLEREAEELRGVLGQIRDSGVPMNIDLENQRVTFGEEVES